MPTSAATQFCFYFSSAPSLCNILIFHERDKLVFTDLVRIFLELIALSGQVWVGLPRGTHFSSPQMDAPQVSASLFLNGAVNK